MIKSPVGFGDDISNLLEKLGIKNLHEKITKQKSGCGKCGQRRARLNQMLPYNKADKQGKPDDGRRRDQDKKDD